MNVKKYPLSPFSGPALNPWYFLAIGYNIFCWLATYSLVPSKSTVHKHMLLGSNFRISVTKYFLALLVNYSHFPFYYVFNAIPNWNCWLSTSLKLAGQTLLWATNLWIKLPSYMNLIPSSKVWKMIESYMCA